MTTIKILGSGDESRLEAFLLPRLDSSMFLLGNMRKAGLVDTGERYAGTYAASVEAGKITGVVAHVGQGNLLCQARVDQVEALAWAAVRQSERGVHGVVGPAAQVGAVRGGLAIEENQVQLDTTEQLYHLALGELILPAPLRSGAVRGRRIEQRDLDQLSAWRVAYAMETLGADDTPSLQESSRAGIERSLEEGTGWVLEADGENVAFSYFNAALTEAVQIGGVWTPPELRGRGYARAVVAASLAMARGDGIGKAILFTDDDNFAAQKAYRSIGFTHVGDYRLLLLNSPATMLNHETN